jgi:hypothetical protein
VQAAAAVREVVSLRRAAAAVVLAMGPVVRAVDRAAVLRAFSAE